MTGAHPTPADVIELHDSTPTRSSRREELDRPPATGEPGRADRAGPATSTSTRPDLTGVDVHRTRSSSAAGSPRRTSGADLVRRGAHVVPPLLRAAVPDPAVPPLHAGRPGRRASPSGGFAGMYDTVVYEHFLAHGGALPEVREALAPADARPRRSTTRWPTPPAAGSAAHGPAVGGRRHGRARRAARVAPLPDGRRAGWRLARAGRLVVTGGGPGVMEAANLGAYLADRPAERPGRGDRPAGRGAGLPRPRPLHGGGAGGARQPVPPTPAAAATGADPATGRARGGLAIPTWLYGHEPANLFAGRIAKYFSNAIREDTILRLARGGIVFAAGPGRHGAGGVPGGDEDVLRHRRRQRPVRLPGPRVLDRGAAGGDAAARRCWPRSPLGDLRHLIHITDDVRRGRPRPDGGLRRTGLSQAARQGDVVRANVIWVLPVQ